MQVINYTELRDNLKKILDQTADQHEPVIINRNKADNVVLISQHDYESLKETTYLLSNDANAKHLRQSITSYKANKARIRKLIGD